MSEKNEKKDEIEIEKEYEKLKESCKIFGFRTLSALGRGNEFVDVSSEDLPNSKFGKSLADETYFVPSSEMVKRVKQGASSVVGEYDFADGKDTGKSDMLFARRRGLDMAEVTQKLYQSRADFEGSQRDLAVEIAKNISDKQKQKKADAKNVSQPVSNSASGSASSGSVE